MDPTLGRGGSPPTHPTQNYPKRFRSIQRITGYVHYRVVQPEPYVPLEMFKDPKNLTQIMYDTILGKSPSGYPMSHRSLFFGNTGPLQQGDSS